MNQLANYIKKFILNNGPISIAQYMSIISYHQSFGYYENHEIGDDFITSPQISKAFGGLIGLFFYDFYLQNYNNQDVIFVELGSGNGDLMHSILEIFCQIPNLTSKFSIYIVENSDFLTNLQQKKLEKFSKKLIKINWVKDIGLININKPLFIFSNEFFDCLPIHQFFYEKNGLSEILVNYNEQINKFFLCLSRKPSNISYYVNTKSFNINDIIEVSPTAINLIKYINSLLVKFGGISLIIDYGYYEQNGKSTLQIISKNENQSHKSINDKIHFNKYEQDFYTQSINIDYVTKNLGDFDISSHVNFESLSNNLTGCTNSFFTQKEFLQNLEFNKLKMIKNTSQNLKILDDNSSETKIGELFKVLISKKI